MPAGLIEPLERSAPTWLSSLAQDDLGCHQRSCPPGKIRMMGPAMSLWAGSRGNASFCTCVQSKLIVNTTLNVKSVCVWVLVCSQKHFLASSRCLIQTGLSMERELLVQQPQIRLASGMAVFSYSNSGFRICLSLSQLCFLRQVLLLLWQVSQ